MYKILIVEDDQTIAKSIAEYLNKWNYKAKVTKDFKNVKEEFLQFDPQLILLDISLPFFNGYYWCNEIRKISEVPIIFISSTSEEVNIIMSMDMGADDFVVKPFDLDLLRSKINALIRRTYSFSNQQNLLEYEGFVLNLDNSKITYQNREANLTKNEFLILEELMENRGKIISRNQLIEKIWQSENFIDDNTLSVNIARLRNKLESITLDDFIVTKKGQGYLVN